MQSTVLAIDYGVHFDTQLYPFSLIEIVSTLEKLGYDISPDIPFPRPIGRFQGTGEIGRKGKSAVHIESNAQALLTSGESISSCLASFNELVKTLTEDHKVEVDSLVKYYRVSATYEVETKNNAINKIAEKLKMESLPQFESIINEDIRPIEIRFASNELNPNSENWFDMGIRTNYERSDRYIFSIIYRNMDKQKVQNFTSNINENVIKIAEFIDR